MSNSIALTESASRGVHTGVPTFFRALCFEASQGGKHGYRWPGYHLGNGLASQQPYDISIDEWGEEIEKLQQLLDADDDDGAWQWFKDHYPVAMELIPLRRRGLFIQGVRHAHEEGRVSL